jgi:hypothetical protein
MIDFLQTISMTSARQLLLSIVAITIGTALPAAPEQNSTQDLKAAAAALIAQRVQLYNKKDAAGIAAEFTPDAIFVELLPTLAVIAEQQKSRSTTNSSLMPAPPDLIKRSRKWS